MLTLLVGIVQNNKGGALPDYGHPLQINITTAGENCCIADILRCPKI